MTIYDVFNGDADGICSLVQLHLVEPRQSQLVTGVKRDIKLLDNLIVEEGDHVNALDISMDKNKAGLLAILEKGASVFYCDHHVSGDIPDNPKLDSLINTAPDVCTSLLINGRLNAAFPEWAVVGAFGDNLKSSAIKLASTLNINPEQLERMDNLGVYINYNGYGAGLEDLHFKPDELFSKVKQFENPLLFMEQDVETFGKLESGYQDDMHLARSATVLKQTEVAAAYLLPDERWARRVSGVFGNALANEYPERAHAVLTERADSTYLVSVRAPLENKQFADELCMAFPTGGGRKAAAGINALPADLLDGFLDKLQDTYRG